MSGYVSLSLYFGQYAVHPGSGQISCTATDAQEPRPPWCQKEPWCLTTAPAIAPASGSVSHPVVVTSPRLAHLCVASPSHLVSQLFQYPHNPLIITSLCLKGRVPIPGWTLPNTNNILVKGFLAKLLIYNNSIGLCKNWYYLLYRLLLVAYLTWEGVSTVAGEGTLAPPSTPSSSLPFPTQNQSACCVM